MKCPVKYKNFQYRLNLKKIVTNNDLFEWRMRDNFNCTFCDNAKETLLHLFWECETIQGIINVFYSLCEASNEIIIRNYKAFIFSWVMNQEQHILNFVSIFLKQFIYRCRCQMKKPNVQQCIYELNKLQHIDYCIALQENKIGKHINRWSPIFDYNTF